MGGKGQGDRAVIARRMALRPRLGSSRTKVEQNIPRLHAALCLYFLKPVMHGSMNCLCSAPTTLSMHIGMVTNTHTRIYNYQTLDAVRCASSLLHGEKPSAWFSSKD